MPRNRSSVSSEKSVEQVASIKYSAKWKNIPSAGLEAHGRIEEAPKIRYCRENGTLVAEVIRFLQNVKPNGGHAILRGGPNSAYRIQLMVMRRRTVRGEVDSDPHSKSKYRLDEGQCGALQKRGWKLPAGQTSGNYQQDWPAESVLRRALIARQVIRTFIEVFRHLPDEKLKFEF